MTLDSLLSSLTPKTDVPGLRELLTAKSQLRTHPRAILLSAQAQVHRDLGTYKAEPDTVAKLEKVRDAIEELLNVNA